METNNEVCSKCGKPKSSSGGATITQWISVCRCDVLAFDPDSRDTEKEEYKICATCGKRVEQTRQGSMTQWIFRESSCRCQFPQVEIPGQEPHSQKAASTTRRSLGNIDPPSIPVELGVVMDEQFQPRSINKTPAILVSALVIGGVLAILSVFAFFLAMTPQEKKLETLSASIGSPVELEMMDRKSPPVVGVPGLKVSGAKVIEVQRFMPAQIAGVQVGDRITKIDDQEIKDQSTKEIEKLLMGNHGKPVTLRLSRGQESVEATIIRAEDIYEGLPAKLSAEDYYKLGVDDKFTGRANKSRLEFTLASELGDKRMKMLAQRQITSELPKDYVAPRAEELNNTAHNLLCRGAYKVALVQLRQCIDEYPNFEWPYLELGLYYYAREESEKAAELCKKVTEINPLMSRGWITLSMAYEQLGNKAEAEQCMNEALKLNEEAGNVKSTLLEVSNKLHALYKNTDKRLKIKKKRPMKHREEIGESN